MKTKVLDNFLDSDYLELIKEIVPTLDYKLHGSIDKLNFLNSAGYPYPHTDCFYVLAKKVSNMTNSKVLRCYVNLNPSGEAHAGEFHEDDGDITALFMPFNWNIERGGSLKFYDGEEIEYRENRLVIFDAKRPHRAMPHSFEGFRYTVAFKMQKNIT